MGTENLYGWYFFTGIPGFLSAELYGTGTGEGQSAACMLKKTDPVDSADLILPLFIQNKVFAVFLAEPISDILAAIITTSTFFRRFDKILDRR